MSWLRNLFSALIQAAGVPAYQRTTLNHYGPGAPTVTDNPAQDRTDFYYSAAPLSGAFGSQDITVGTGTPPELQIGFVAHALTTDATPATLLTYPLPAASTSDMGLRVVANLGGAGSANQNSWPTIWRFLANGVRYGSSVFVGADQDSSTISAPFITAAGSPTSGTVNASASGNNLVIQVQGFAPPSAWASGHAYNTGNGSSTPGVTANGNVYVCVSSGSSSGSAPSGTGTNLGTGALFTFVAVGSHVPIAWTLVVTGLVTG